MYKKRSIHTEKSEKNTSAIKSGNMNKTRNKKIKKQSSMEPRNSGEGLEGKEGREGRLFENAVHQLPIRSSDSLFSRFTSLPTDIVNLAFFLLGRLVQQELQGFQGSVSLVSTIGVDISFSHYLIHSFDGDLFF